MTDEDHSKDVSMTTSQAGKLGGDKVNQERGPKFYSEIGKKQGKANNPGNFANRPRATEVEAVEPTTALRIGKELLYDLVEDHHELARDLLAMLAASIVQLVE